MFRNPAVANLFSAKVQTLFPPPKTGDPGSSLNGLAETLADLSIQPSARTVMAIGFGVNDQPLPLRSLAYAVPVLRLLAEMPLATTLEIYFATQGVLRANAGANVDRINTNSALLKRALSAYIRERYPDLQDRIRLLDDAPVAPDSELERFLRGLTDTLIKQSARDSEVRDFAERRGGAPAYRYMAEHAVYMRDPIQPKPVQFLMVPEMQPDMDCVVMVGGKAEKIFFRARQLISDALSLTPGWRSEQLFTPLGLVRPCYFMEQAEPILEELANLEPSLEALIEKVRQGVKPRGDIPADRQVLSDLLVLLADLGDLSLLPGKGLTKAFLNGDPPEAEYRAIERGLARLRGLRW